MTRRVNSRSEGTFHAPARAQFIGLRAETVQNLPISLAVWKAAEVAAVMFRGLRQSPIW